MSEAQQPVHHAEIASHIPGRLRVRLDRASRQPQVLHGLKEELAGCPGVHEVAVNPGAGSLTIQYDAHRYPGTGIFGVLEDLDMLVAAVTGAPRLEGPAEGRGPSQAALTVVEALDDLDRRLFGLTGHTLNLRVLFPFGLAGLGVGLTLTNGLGLKMIPGWLPLWLAFDAFVKLHPQRA
jgi:Heavy metal associated domain 2